MSVLQNTVMLQILFDYFGIPPELGHKAKPYTRRNVTGSIRSQALTAVNRVFITQKMENGTMRVIETLLDLFHTIIPQGTDTLYV